jgi:SPP1 gp7 family putative phage head morphogenesis protein
VKVRTRRHGGKSRPVSNQKKRKNPLRVDPTRTQTLRRKFLARIRKQFGLLKGRLIRLVVDEDAFGIKLRQQGISANSNPEGCNQYKPCGTSPTEVSGSLTDLVAHYESHPDPQVRSALGKAYDRAVNLISGLALKKLPEKALESVDEWIYKQTVTAAGHEVLGIPATALLLKVGSAGAAKAWLKVRKAITGNTLSANSDDDPLTVLRELLKRLAEVGGWEVPSEEEMRKMLEISPQKPTTNVRFAFRTDPEKITAFQDWLRTQFGQLLTGKNEEGLWQAFTEDGYRRGAGRTFDDTKSSAYVRANATDTMPHYEGTRDEFLRSAFAGPVAVEKVKLLAGRAFDDLENVTSDMSTRMSRTLTDGLVTGSSPRDIARDLSDDLDLSRGRAETIARTEIIRAHAEGQLDAMETLGVTQVGVQAEWLITDDEKLCDECAPLEGIVLDIDEARGMLPRHPNCRCAWMPANVGEDDEDQKRSAKEIEAAVRDSQEAGDDDFDIDVSTVRPTRNTLWDQLVGNSPDFDEHLFKLYGEESLPPHLLEFSRLLGNFDPDQPRDEHGRFSHSVVTEGSHEAAEILLSQGIRPDFKRERVVSEFAPGAGLEREGAYVARENAFSKGSFGPVRMHLNVPESKLDVPQEMKQLGYEKGKEVAGKESLDYVLGTENGGVTKGEIAPEAFHKVEVYQNGKWESMTPAEYLASREVAEVPRLPGMKEYEASLRKHADEWGLKEHNIQKLLTDYNRAKLTDKHYLAQDAGLATNARSFLAECERDQHGWCLASGEGGKKQASPKELKAARKLAMEKAANAPVPTKEDVAKAQEGIARLGANKYRRNIVGNTKDRAKRRQHLYDEFGDGSTCPCIYCGIKVGEGTLEQDKIYTTAEGGKYNTKNVVPSCGECNKKRGDVPFREIQWGKVK